MERVIGAFEARRKFGKLLRDVEMKGGPVVVERNGERVAAVVPIGVYDTWKRERDTFFRIMEATAQRAELSDEEAMELALEAQRWARTQK